MKKKGFTLIELLAVIIILGIIALIVGAVIGNVIERTRKETFKQSVTGIIQAGENYIVKYLFDSNGVEPSYPVTFICDGTECTNGTDKLEFQGAVPKSGSIVINGRNTINAEYINNGRYCASGVKGNIQLADSCSEIDITNPILRGVLEGKVLKLNLTDNESGIAGYCVNAINDYNSCGWITTSQNYVEHELQGAGTWYIYAKDKKGNISNSLEFTADQSAFCFYETGSSHSVGDTLSYGGADWYILNDNGSTLTLVLKGNYATGSYGATTDFSSSNVNTILNTDFINTYQGIKDSIAINQLVLQSTNTYVRLLTKDEVTNYGSSILNTSATPYWTMTADGANIWYAQADGTLTYQNGVCNSTSYTYYVDASYYNDGSKCWKVSARTINGYVAVNSAADAVASPDSTTLTASKTAATSNCSSYPTSCWTTWDTDPKCGTEIQITSSCSSSTICTSCSAPAVTADAGIRPVIEVKACHLN